MDYSQSPPASLHPLQGALSYMALKVHGGPPPLAVFRSDKEQLPFIKHVPCVNVSVEHQQRGAMVLICARLGGGSRMG